MFFFPSADVVKQRVTWKDCLSLADICPDLNLWYSFPPTSRGIPWLDSTAVSCIKYNASPGTQSRLVITLYPSFPVFNIYSFYKSLQEWQGPWPLTDWLVTSELIRRIGGNDFLKSKKEWFADKNIEGIDVVLERRVQEKTSLRVESRSINC